MVLTGGQIHDSEPFFDLFDDVKLFGNTLLADKAYFSESIHYYLEESGEQICIPYKVNLKVKHAFDAELYKRRNLVERFFQLIKNYRHITTRYDKFAVCFLNFVLLVSAAIHF